MITVEGFNGEKYKGTTHRQIVEEMRRASWGGSLSDGVRGFMVQVAKRMQDWSGAAVRTTSCRAFLNDLVKAGMIRMQEKP